MEKMSKSSPRVPYHSPAIIWDSSVTLGWHSTLSVWLNEKAFRTGPRESFSEMQWKMVMVTKRLPFAGRYRLEALSNNWVPLNNKEMCTRGLRDRK